MKSFLHSDRMLTMLATAEISSTVVALAAMWLVIEFGMGEPLTRRMGAWILECFGIQRKKDVKASETYPDDEPPRPSKHPRAEAGNLRSQMSGALPANTTKQPKIGWSMIIRPRKAQGEDVERTG
jgi:hypothetical protein